MSNTIQRLGIAIFSAAVLLNVGTNFASAGDRGGILLQSKTQSTTPGSLVAAPVSNPGTLVAAPVSDSSLTVSQRNTEPVSGLQKLLNISSQEPNSQR